MSGRFTGKENKLLTLVLPSLNRNCWFLLLIDSFVRCRGDSQGRRCIILLSFSPLFSVVIRFYVVSCLYIHVGEIHRRGEFNHNSRSPLMNRNLCFDHIL